MAVIRVSILVDIDDENTNVERDDILDIAFEQAINNPEKFLLKPLDLEDESDWEDYTNHPVIIEEGK